MSASTSAPMPVFSESGLLAQEVVLRLDAGLGGTEGRRGGDRGVDQGVDVVRRRRADGQRRAERLEVLRGDVEGPGGQRAGRVAVDRDGDRLVAAAVVDEVDAVVLGRLSVPW